MSPCRCPDCGTSHSASADCPGELRPTTPERQGFRVNVDTPRGIEAFGVLLAACGEQWRARILTYPNAVWLVPGGKTSLKFLAPTAEAAELQAIEFIRSHCRMRDYTIREPLRGEKTSQPLQPANVDVFTPPYSAAIRKIRFLPVRFGVIGATEPGGTGNLSETGIFIITCLPLDSGVRLKMTLDVDERDIDLDGCVRWMQRTPHGGMSPGMGIQLIAPPPPYIKYVRDLN